MQNKYILANTCQIPNLGDLYRLFLGFKNNGSFVVVGAFDGEYVSNTSGLADIGWSGLYIEPVNEYYLKCKERHKNNDVKVVNFAVGEIEKDCHISKAGPISSINEDVVKLFNTLGWSKKIHKGKYELVHQRKLDNILIDEQIKPGFDILSIDVEGQEWKVLKGFTINFWLPKIVIVELHDTNVDYKIEWEDAEQIRNYFKVHQYRIIYKDTSNTIFLNEEVKYNGK